MEKGNEPKPNIRDEEDVNSPLNSPPSNAVDSTTPEFANIRSENHSATAPSATSDVSLTPSKKSEKNKTSSLLAALLASSTLDDTPMARGGATCSRTEVQPSMRSEPSPLSLDTPIEEAIKQTFLNYQTKLQNLEQKTKKHSALLQKAKQRFAESTRMTTAREQTDSIYITQDELMLQQAEQFINELQEAERKMIQEYQSYVALRYTKILQEQATCRTTTTAAATTNTLYQHVGARVISTTQHNLLSKVTEMCLTLEQRTLCIFGPEEDSESDEESDFERSSPRSSRLSSP